MQTKLILASVLTLLSYATPTFAEEKPPHKPSTDLVIEAHDIYIPEERAKEEKHKVLVEYEKDFTFDWNNSASIISNQKKAQALYIYLKKIDKPANDLNAEDQELMAMLLYRLGTFYSHIMQQPLQAIETLETAVNLHTDKEVKAWDYDQLAYAYEQKYRMTRQAADRERGFYYSGKVINELYPNTKNKEVAFAYGVRGAMLSSMQQYPQAEEQFKKALGIYEGLSNERDEQYIRIKTRLAETLMEADNEHNAEVIAILEDGQKYWQEKDKSITNLYAAYNLIILGQAYLKAGDPKAAQKALQQASVIYEKVYGEKSQHLGLPYQLLAQAYQKMGDVRLGETYTRKANNLVKG